MKAIVAAVFVIAFSSHHAFAVSHAVKMACKDDYFTHCSMHAVGSPGVRQCMRAVGPRLSQRCLGALANAGEIKKSKLAANKTVKSKDRISKKQLANKASGKQKLAAKATAKKKLAKAGNSKQQVAGVKSGAGKSKGATTVARVNNKAAAKTARNVKAIAKYRSAAQQRYAARH